MDMLLPETVQPLDACTPTPTAGGSVNVKAEIDRLFAQVFPGIPKPAELAPTDPVDADETANGICAQGESDDQ